MKPAARTKRNSAGRGALRVLLLLAWVLSFPAAALAQTPGQPGQPAAPRNLLAHGNQDHQNGLEYFWVAQVTTDARPGLLPAGTPPASTTHFYARRAGAAGWQEWGEVSLRAVSLASRGPQLVALL